MITVLTSDKFLTKQITRTTDDWETQPYDRPTKYAAQEFGANSLNDLADIIEMLKDEPHSMIIRGKLKRGIDPASVYRRKTHADASTNDFEETAVRWIMIDFDSVSAPPQINTPALRLEYLVAHLPPEFHDASFVYQWSSSAGLRGWDTPKCHLWFWLAEPFLCSVLRGKAIQEVWACDKAVFDPVQPHYTASPIFKNCADPLGDDRFGIVHKVNQEVRLTAWVKPVPIIHPRSDTLPQGNRLQFHLDRIGNPELHEAARATIAFYYLANGYNSDDYVITDLVTDRVNQSGRSSSDKSRVLKDISRMISGAKAKYR
jgi:hypothetical protein